MSLTEMNVNDLDQLKRLRLQRLLHFFTNSLTLCLIQIDVSNNTLAVYCSQTETFHDLLNDFEDLCRYAWLIVGVRAIALYFCQEEILRTDIYFN